MVTKLELKGGSIPVTFEVKKYYEGGLCLSLTDCSEGYHMQFCRLTVNLGPVPDVDMNDSAFVDTNNCPWAEKFLTDLGVAVPSGIIRQQGHWMYPLYYFNLEEIKKYQ